MLDRLAPSVRPAEAPVARHKWRSLLFLHWPIPVAAMRPLVPKSLELDLWQGTAFVGLVPFAMRDIEVRFWPRRWAFDFLETNVRTYVHDGSRPGVYFLSLDANSRLAVWGARTAWGLPYHFARMQLDQRDGEHRYVTQRARGGATFRARCRPGEFLGASQPGTLEHFLLERYYLFVERRGALRSGQVWHTPYSAQRVETFDVRDELAAAAGLPPLQGPPLHAHYAAGVDVEVFGLQSVAGLYGRRQVSSGLSTSSNLAGGGVGELLTHPKANAAPTTAAPTIAGTP